MAPACQAPLSGEPDRATGLGRHTLPTSLHLNVCLNKKLRENHFSISTLVARDKTKRHKHYKIGLSETDKGILRSVSFSVIGTAAGHSDRNTSENVCILKYAWGGGVDSFKRRAPRNTPENARGAKTGRPVHTKLHVCILLRCRTSPFIWTICCRHAF